MTVYSDNSDNSDNSDKLSSQQISIVRRKDSKSKTLALDYLESLKHQAFQIQKISIPLSMTLM